MPQKGKLSAYCLIDHFGLPPEAVEEMLPEAFRIVTPLRFALAKIDRKFHFVGLQGYLWRLLGTSRSVKNPNICNA